MKRLVLSIFTIFACATLFAQVGIGTITPSNASMLEVSNTSDNVVYGGFMPPRFDNETQRNLINPGPGDFGLLVFVVDAASGTPANSGCLQLWTGGAWENIHCTGGAIVVPPNDIPWINEIHYDNAGGDVGEGVEIAGMAGIDLTDYQLILYNGSVGTTYDTLTLTGAIDDEGTGHGAVWFPISSIQNGNPDGIALYNTATSSVIQFLSYGGTFGANNGPAQTMNSIDIGVNETGTTPVGESLQLTGGPGDEYVDFNWQAPATASPGTINPGQTIN
ncbi:hypothetical protein [Ulvibacter litoralis]|uniref:Uncharacterized protein n=1 Tax=Ulvibacter litoralis TaxID=227084 RepID=A0A1G7FPR5_9FLAO|nr:hypothetical protein [Ulvibacter litoralis]GHC50239.1 hypothetical protein GCM10008083_12190 [Ulvibacter litoralis]SDE77900.1 hypothetical protein SAMN05421855_102692 [Ulvibacter litoralis]